MSHTGMTLGIIGGSGLHQLKGLKVHSQKRVLSDYGEPSDDLLFGSLDGHHIVFLPRHGHNHNIPPSMVNYRANIDSLKRSGVDTILAFNSVGSLQERYTPGSFVLVDQFIDFTSKRQSTFFDRDIVAHVSMAQPVCPRLANCLKTAMRHEGYLELIDGGVCLVIEGPQFSSLAESNLFRSWGCDLINMTAMPEAKLAREAELCYACVAMVTDYDCWHPAHESVSASDIVATFRSNIDRVHKLIAQAIPQINAMEITGCACRTALDHAIITLPDALDPNALERLSTVAGRVIRPKDH